MKFIVQGEPKGKARPRMTKTGHTYTPEDTVAYENWVKVCYQNAGGKHFGDAPVLVEIECYYAIPKAFSERKKEAALSGELRPTKKPDMDNIAKAVLDSLNGIAYADDKQVTGLWVQKFYDKEPRLEVRIVKDGETYETYKK